MRVRLVSVDPAAPKRRIVVKRLPAVIGRSAEAQVRVSDPWVSRRHCEIDQGDQTLLVRDLGSKHGTYVNGQRAGEAHLLPGDRLTIGSTSLEIVYRCRRKPRLPTGQQSEPAVSF
jgi:pSer/pThr/pTyr-binding forkhead associated (FHA) protein